MKQLYLYGLFTLFLCVGFTAQAQRVVAYQTKLSEMTPDEVRDFTSMLEADYNENFVNFRTLQNSADEVASIVIVDLKWNGQDEIQLPAQSVQQMTALRYIYLRSYRGMDDSFVEQHFSALIRQLERLENEVELVYFTMEKPN